MSSTPSTPHILDGWATLDDFAREVKKHPRTVLRWPGLPVTYFGKTPYLHIATTRSWLLSRQRRSRKARAA
jgi:hypothetical protein